MCCLLPLNNIVNVSKFFTVCPIFLIKSKTGSLILTKFPHSDAAVRHPAGNFGCWESPRGNGTFRISALQICIKEIYCQCETYTTYMPVICGSWCCLNACHLCNFWHNPTGTLCQNYVDMTHFVGCCKPDTAATQVLVPLHFSALW